MIAETEAYKFLVADEELNRLFNQFRGKEFPGGYKVSSLTIFLRSQRT